MWLKYRVEKRNLQVSELITLVRDIRNSIRDLRTNM